jgi:predicted transcriptional regulator YheO|tara:strand:- start:1703 stop:2350 length:648 start_codon:yes stop_codon:yes gene_type:complete
MSNTNKLSVNGERDLILREVGKIAEALAATLAPLCEVVLHDLTTPEQSVVRIDNNLSGRLVGDPATELGLARISDPNFPDQLVNYSNALPDGRKVKSTSIGLKDSSGKYIAALCLNLDVSYLKTMSAYLEKLTAFSDIDGVSEHITSSTSFNVEEAVRVFAHSKNKDPGSLSSKDKRQLLSQLNTDGSLQIRGAVDEVAKLVGISRSSVYYYLKN